MRHSRKWLAIGSLAFLAAIVITIGLLAWSSTPQFCASCHLMETRYVSWRNSDHAMTTNCLSCHAEPGWRGEMKAHIAGARYLYAYVSGRISGPILMAEVPNANCSKCHPDETLTEYPGPNEVHHTYHNLHLERGMRCTNCHGGLAHATMLPVKARSAMALCETCHANRSEPIRSCHRCHPFGPSGPALRQHGQAARPPAPSAVPVSP